MASFAVSWIDEIALNVHLVNVDGSPPEMIFLSLCSIPTIGVDVRTIAFDIEWAKTTSWRDIGCEFDWIIGLENLTNFDEKIEKRPG